MIHFNRWRHTFTERFPEPSKEFQYGSGKVENNEITINCEGKDLDDEDSDIVDYEYKWELRLPDVLKPHYIELLKIAFVIMNKKIPS